MLAVLPCGSLAPFPGADSVRVTSLPSVYVTFKLEPEPTTVYPGHTAMFQCQAEGDPVPHIQWKGKDKILDPGKLLPRYTLSIPN